MERAEADAVYEQGRDAVVSVLLALSEQNERLGAQVEKLTARVAAQDARIANLERELGRSSRNSSQPPSADPPGQRGASRGRSRGKDSSGRSQGAQSGHEGHGRELLPASAVDEVVEYWPARCGCGREFARAELVPAGEPQRHQVEELPVISTVVVEHRAQRERRLREEWELDGRVNAEYERSRARGINRRWAPVRRPRPTPLRAAREPAGVANTTDPCSRKVKAPRGYMDPMGLSH